ncbi:MAG: DUF2207 domain-containing protein [Eggerthellaceae bacterium]
MQYTRRANCGITGCFAGRRGLRPVLPFVLSLLFALAFACAFAPALAFADSNPDSGEYSIERVTISANVQTDGSLHVVEQRVIRFEENHANLCWWQDLPGGDSVEYLTGISVAQMDSIDQQELDLVPLEYVEYDPEWREGVVPSRDVCSFDAEHGRTYAFFDVTGEYVLLQSEYDIVGAVQLYKDCAELRWKFVAAGQWSSASQNVSCTVSLPVPADAQPQVGKDVYGWSHGPEGGGLSFDAGVNSVTVWEEIVPSDEYSEVRILMPAEWISNATPEVASKHAGSLRRDKVLQEELEWVDQKAYRRLSELSAFTVFAILSFLLTAFALVMYALFGRVRKVKGEADVPLLGFAQDASTPVISRLWHWNRALPQDFAACVLGLIEKGAIRVGWKRVDGGLPEVGEADGAASAASDPTAAEDGAEGPAQECGDLCYLEETGAVPRSKLDGLEKLAMGIIFDSVGAGSRSVWVDDIACGGGMQPEQLSYRFDSWHSKLKRMVAQAGYFESRGLFWQRALVLVVVAYLVVAVAVSVALNSFWPALLALACAIAVVAIANQLGRRSKGGSAAYAACQRLRAVLAADARATDGEPGEAAKSKEAARSEQAVEPAEDAEASQVLQGAGAEAPAERGDSGEAADGEADRALLDALSAGEWAQLLTCAYAIDAREAAVAAIERRLAEGEDVGRAQALVADGTLAAFLDACRVHGDSLPACEQVALAVEEVYRNASWKQQRKRAKAAKSGFFNLRRGSRR